ncbi:MAG: hypothetical protein C0591_10815 [Marinilabiliales bacterium]|nr:MAG: hypothetical protein C0591_10815 [Marinilabiliales bacterium]
MKRAFRSNKTLRTKYSRTFLFLASLLVGIIIVLVPVISDAQETKIMGQVIDAQSKEPIPFANIIIKSTSQGTLTDFDGTYSIEINHANNDSIRASLLGFKPMIKAVAGGQFQTINFELELKDEDLPEVVILYTGNPADALIDSIIKYKKTNEFKPYTPYKYNAYAKVQMDANNVSARLMNRKLMDPFKFILDYVDTSTISGKSYLPIMITETMSEVYERSNPKSKKEVVFASKVAGLDSLNIIQFIGKLSQDVNIYSNFNELFEKNFVSPIADFGHDFYKYYLVDSAFMGGKWCYHIMFKPKRRQELTYTGGLWVNDTSYAITDIELRIADDANLNFVNDMGIKQEFSEIGDTSWIKSKEKLFVDFNVVENTRKIVGAYGYKTSIFSDFRFNVPNDSSIFRSPVNVILQANAFSKDDLYWNKIRPEELSKTEDGIYKMIDSVKKVPAFKRYRNISYMLVTGYVPWGKIELGPYFKLFSYNAIEGARFRIGGRTTTTFSKKINLEAYVAYGTLDETFKYGGKLLYLPQKNPRRSLLISYTYDLEQLGLSPTARATDNILSSFFSRGPIDKLTFVREYKMAYEYEWFHGLINTVNLTRRELFPLGDDQFIIYPDSRNDTVYTNSITTSEIGLDTRISFKETYIDGKFNRATIKSDYPIITIGYRYGVPLSHNKDYTYHKLNIGIEQWFNVGIIGWSRFIIDAGKIWGTLPYPLLRIHDGNETWLFDQGSSNMMDYYEFVSDQYINWFYTHHFDGYFFNKIPGFRKLKWREVVYFRGVYGTLTNKNLSFSEFPDNLRPFGNEPYLETGAGIENIFKVLRIYAIWRLTHLNDPGNPDVAKFGIFATIYFSF